MSWFNIETLDSKTFWLGALTTALAVATAIPAAAPFAIIATKVFAGFTAMAIADSQTTIKKATGAIPADGGK